MDQHPMDPRHPVSPAPRRPHTRLRVLAAAAVVAVAAGTFGTGVYLNRESPTWQRILGTEPVLEVPPKATDELPVLLDSVGNMLEHPATSTGAKTTAALQGARSMLAEHVELLTPGALAAAAASASGAAGTGAEASTAPPSAVPPLTPAEFSERLASAGNGLLHEALTAPGQDARRLSGAGFELVLQARTVLSAAGAPQAAIDALPTPATELAAQAAETTSAAASASASSSAAVPAAAPTVDRAAAAKMPEFTFSACPAIAPSDGKGTGTTDSGQLLGEVIDAAYRMGYAYDVAGARTSAGLRTAAWNRSEVLVEFAKSLEKQLDAAHDCEPIRQPAYQLPADAISNPMDAARSGEAQLALLLRDAAAGQVGEPRAYLFNAAWAQGLQARQVTGKVPDFTAVAGTPKPTDASASSG
ncbi:hypothetical protein [Paeniglutamicibacter psychrophenolicus]|uniref:hypothetical protein n=1 Tax=Paeniglutamicibacter psychrophenolicus TaxID=257454 RepID=UPI0027872462|nr:hypothetical protein [Paeniglutamicibacter psychrophenolicus]MDQ0094829.1 hypothetical protein [Paeniglutamicibacter psychrophenolicus]